MNEGSIEQHSTVEGSNFDKEFENALLELERLKQEKRKKRKSWLRKYNKLKDTFIVEYE